MKEELMTTAKDLTTGDWVLINYAFGATLFYVKANFGGRVFLGRDRWLVSAGEVMTYERLDAAMVAYVGRGTVRWWWRLLPWRDLVCPISKTNEIPFM